MQHHGSNKMDSTAQKKRDFLLEKAKPVEPKHKSSPARRRWKLWNDAERAAAKASTTQVSSK